ncbi:MAG TPA: uroporphyrinogen-III synthase [Noviherbaspirillum sp.]|nr:uroporphyrinogen-III synthase [Noviherbaspirillum sp.]
MMKNCNVRPVVITRPLAQARPLAQRIAETGREAVVFPLLEILPLSNQTNLRDALQKLDKYAMVAFVSPNAIDAAFGLLDSWPAQVAVAVVGEGSKIALARHGVTSVNATIFSPVDPTRTDSQTLLEVLDLQALRGKRVLIIRGETGRELLSDALRAHGVEVERVAAYRRVAPVLDQGGRAQLLRLLDCAADWVITSSEALHILVQMVREVAGDIGLVKMQQQNIIVPHVRIAETAQMLGFTNITQTGSGDEQLIAALQFRA